MCERKRKGPQNLVIAIARAHDDVIFYCRGRRMRKRIKVMSSCALAIEYINCPDLVNSPCAGMETYDNLGWSLWVAEL